MMQQRLLPAVVGLLALVTSAAAQPPGSAPPPLFKGIWEPVSFTEDIRLRSVFFVTVDKGWVAGEKGTLIHTKDGGATWTAQMGGDPQAAEEPVEMLTFVDENTGWAVKDGRILHTTDGESWEDLGKAPPSIDHLVMSSATEGVAAGDVGIGSVPSTLFKTRDGGKTWKPGAECKVKAQVEGLTRELTCRILRIQFVSPTHGWLVAHHQCVGSGCDPPPILGKTEDGGETWAFFVGGGDPTTVGSTDLYFTSENVGVVRLTDGKLVSTSDGGQNWKGLLATVGRSGKLLFADPEVGWALEEQKLSYTIDGGARWNSRAFRFAARPEDWSFPRRDRAYVVGEHGMVMRYRVVPQSEPVKPGVVLAPAMPAFASPLDEQMPQIEGFVQELTTTVAALPDSAAAAAGAAAGGAAGASGAGAGGVGGGASGAEPAPAAGGAGGGGFSQDVPPTPFVNKCCGKPLNKFNAILAAVLQSLPQFVQRFKNTNLLTAGLRMLVTMPKQLGDLRGAYRSFKQATDKAGAQAALTQLASAATSLGQSTKAAFQKPVIQ